MTYHSKKLNVRKICGWQIYQFLKKLKNFKNMNYVTANSFSENFGTLVCSPKNFAFNWNENIPVLAATYGPPMLKMNNLLLPPHFFFPLRLKCSLSLSPTLSLTPNPFLSPYFPPFSTIVTHFVHFSQD